MKCTHVHELVDNEMPIKKILNGRLGVKQLFEGDFSFNRGGTVRSVLMYVSAVTTKSKGKSVEENGSGYWIRTSDQVINSHLLYR